MATLAPNIPERGDPEYLRYSKSIPQPEGNKAGAYLGKGLGEAIQEGSNVAEKIASGYLEQQSYEKFQELENQHKEDLKPTWEYYKSLENPNASSSNSNETEPLAFLGDTTGSLIQKNTDLPPEIRFGTKQAQAQTELRNNGKISQTQYDMEIDSLAKDLHSRYPMFQKEITQGMSRATGRANANQTVTDMISDINRIQGQLNSQANKIDSHIMNGLKDISDPDLRDGITNNHFGKRPGDPGYMDGLTALGHVLRAQSRDVDQKRIETDQNIIKGQNEVDKITTGRNVNSAIATTIDGWQHKIMVANGANTWDELMNQVREVQANPDSIKGQQIANSIASSINQLKAELYKNTRFAARIDPDLDKKLEAAAGYFDRIASDAVGGDKSKLGNIVSSAGNMASAIQQNSKLGWLKVPGLGGALADYEALNSLAPDVSKQFFDTIAGVFKNAGPVIGNHFQETMTKGMSVPPNGTKDQKPLNINQRISEAHDRGATPATLQGYINFVETIKTLPSDKARNLAYMYYGSENLGMVGKWARDSYDSRTGKFSEGQGSILSKMGDKGILDKIWSLGDPKLNNHVQNFLEDAFAKHVFPSLMQDLEGTARFGLAYDNKAQEFMIRSPKEQLAQQGPLSFAHGTSNYAQATQTVKQLNAAMQPIKNLASHLGKDPNAYLVELITAGNPNLGKELTPGSVPQETESAAIRALSNQVLAKKMKEQGEGKDLSGKTDYRNPPVPEDQELGLPSDPEARARELRGRRTAPLSREQ